MTDDEQRLLITDLSSILTPGSGEFGSFSPRKRDSDKNFIQMFDFFTIFARQIIPCLGTPYDALHN